MAGTDDAVSASGQDQEQTKSHVDTTGQDLIESTSQNTIVDIEMTPTSKDSENNTAATPAETDNKKDQAIDVEAQASKLRKEPTLQDQTNLLPTKQIIIVFLGCSSALMLSMLDQTILATVLPTITRDFNAGKISSWTATAYLLTSTGFQPLYGRWSDIFGRKRMMLLGISIFWIGSLACALAQTIVQLVIFRALAGIGGGALISLVMIVVSDVVSMKDRGKYQGVLSMNIAISNGVGPLIGGVIAEKTTWRWCFYLNLPLAGIAFFIVMLALPLKHVKGSIKQKLLKVDYLGCVLVLAASTLMLVGLTWAGGTYSWGSYQVLLPLLLGVAVMAVFCLWELKATLPIMPMRLFGSVPLCGGYFITFTNGLIQYTQLFYLPQFFQTVRGVSPIRSGVLILPLVITMVASSFVAGVIVSKTGHYKTVIVVGWVLWTISLGLISTLDVSSSTGAIVGYLLFTGIGAGQTFQTNLVAIQNAVERKDLAVATACRNFIRMGAGTLSLAIAATIVNTTLRSYVTGLSSTALEQVLEDPTSIHLSTSTLTLAQYQSVLRGYTKGFKLIWYIAAGEGAVSAIVAALTLQQKSLSREDDEARKLKSKEWLQQRKEKNAQKHGHS